MPINIKISNYKGIVFLFFTVSLLFNSRIYAKVDPMDSITPLNAKIEYNKVFPDKLQSINLDIKSEDKLKLRDSTPEIKMDDKIKLTPEEQEFKNALALQKEKDIQDVQDLWKSTVERNPVIKFALEKIAAPPTERPLASSLMAKTLSTMIQGAALVPSIFGAGAATEYSSAFGGQLLNRAFQKTFMPGSSMPSITEPELIQITGIIEDLQKQIIVSYYNYKSALENLLIEKQNTLLQQKNYDNAIISNDETAIIISSALYDKAKLAELKLINQVKLYRIQLERLAGPEAVSNLNL